MVGDTFGHSIPAEMVAANISYSWNMLTNCYCFKIHLYNKLLFFRVNIINQFWLDTWVLSCMHIDGILWGTFSSLSNPTRPDEVTCRSSRHCSVGRLGGDFISCHLCLAHASHWMNQAWTCLISARPHTLGLCLTGVGWCIFCWNVQSYTQYY